MASEIRPLDEQALAPQIEMQETVLARMKCKINLKLSNQPASIMELHFVFGDKSILFVSCCGGIIMIEDHFIYNIFKMTLGFQVLFTFKYLNTM